MPDLRTYQLIVETNGSVENRTLAASSNIEAMRAARTVLLRRPSGTTAKLHDPNGMMIWSEVVD